MTHTEFDDTLTIKTGSTRRDGSGWFVHLVGEDGLPYLSMRGNKDECLENAAIFAHRVNNHDALVEALEAILAGHTLTQKNGVNDWVHKYKINQRTHKQINAALASAKQETK